MTWKLVLFWWGLFWAGILKELGPSNWSTIIFASNYLKTFWNMGDLELQSFFRKMSLHPTKNNLNAITLFSVWFGKEIYSASWSNITKPCTSRFSRAGSQWDKTSCKDLIIVILLDHVTAGKNVIPFPSCAQYYCCIVKLTITVSPCCLSKNSIIVASFKHKATIQVL